LKAPLFVLTARRTVTYCLRCRILMFFPASPCHLRAQRTVVSCGNANVAAFFEEHVGVLSSYADENLWTWDLFNHLFAG